VVLANFETDPAKSPIQMKGIIAPRQNTNRIRGTTSENNRGTIEKKIGARQGSRK
jgi:hypothetical protein